MAMLAWIMMGLALWHFTIFLPDRFWGGIVGAFLGALIGAFFFGLLVNGFTIPGQYDTHLLQALEAIPGRPVSAWGWSTPRASAAATWPSSCSAPPRRGGAGLQPTRGRQVRRAVRPGAAAAPSAGRAGREKRPSTQSVCRP